MARSFTGTNSDSATAVDTDFEAAEILAGLSKSKSSLGGESSPVDSPSNSTLAVPDKKPVQLAFDLNQVVLQNGYITLDQATVFIQEEESRREPKDLVKPEDADMAEPRLLCTTSKVGGTGKSRQNLTEAEKEARRLRRVLANRESARQTIRRRQVLYEELTRKVADLARDNKSLKKEKESVVKDYEALRCTNKMLNKQIAERLGSKLDQNVGKFISANCSGPPLPFANYPYIICKDTPFVCPCNIQVPDMNPSQMGHLSPFSFYHQSDANLSKSSNSESPNAKGNPLSNSGPSGHWCMLPYPLFFPVHDAKNGPSLIPFVPSEDRVNGTGLVNCPRNLIPGCPIDVKAEYPTSSGTPVGKDSREIPSCLAMDVVDQDLRFQSNGVAENADARKAKGLKLANAVNSEEISLKGVDDVKFLQDSHQEPGLKNGKRLVDPAVAAKARKRRKELTRMKSLHYRSHS